MGLVILASVTVAFQGMYDNVEEEVLQRELEGTIQRIAQNIISVYNLGQESGYAIEWTIEIEIALPSNIGGHFFHIEMIDTTQDLHPDSIHGFLHTKIEISAQIDLAPISTEVQIIGSFQSINAKHILRYHPKEASLELIDL